MLFGQLKLNIAIQIREAFQLSMAISQNEDGYEVES